MSMMLRYFLFVVAVIVQASGIALVVKSMLGTSPISSLPYVISLTAPFTLGQMTFSINMLLVLGQYLLLRSVVLGNSYKLHFAAAAFTYRHHIDCLWRSCPGNRQCADASRRRNRIRCIPMLSY